MPDWPAPPGVGAVMSLRGGGASSGPWGRFNLGVACGDAPAAVAANRAAFAAHAGAEPVWLRQVHGTRVLRLPHDDPDSPADAAWTTEPGIACTVQVADCLPVLLCRADGRAVAAAHAGWRGLAAGVVEAALGALCEGTGSAPGDVLAWLGPCIGPRRFEVGADVLRAFGAAEACCFEASEAHADGSPRWLADLPRLAHRRLTAAGVRGVTRADLCTVEDASRFFSFRRDRVTGRMAAAVWIR